MHEGAGSTEFAAWVTAWFTASSPPRKPRAATSAAESARAESAAESAAKSTGHSEARYNVGYLARAAKFVTAVPSAAPHTPQEPACGCQRHQPSPLDQCSPLGHQQPLLCRPRSPTIHRQPGRQTLRFSCDLRTAPRAAAGALTAPANWRCSTQELLTFGTSL